MHHIRNTLPDIKTRIQQNLLKYQNELQQLGGSEGDQNSGNVILNIITEFSADFRTAIEGKNTDLNLSELSGGARISFVFHELYSNGVKSLDPYDQVKDSDIRTILYNSSVCCYCFTQRTTIIDRRFYLTGFFASIVRWYSCL